MSNIAADSTTTYASGRLPVAQAFLPVPQVTPSATRKCLAASRARSSFSQFAFSAVGARHAVPGARIWHVHAFYHWLPLQCRLVLSYQAHVPASFNIRRSASVCITRLRWSVFRNCRAHRSRLKRDDLPVAIAPEKNAHDPIRAGQIRLTIVSLHARKRRKHGTITVNPDVDFRI